MKGTVNKMINYTSRYEKLRAYMKDNGIDAVYVTSPENFLYMSGYNNPDGHMLITMTESYSYNDFRYIEAARAQSFETVKVCPTPEYSMFDVIKSEMIGTIGVEDTKLTMSGYAALLKGIEGSSCKTVELGECFTELRAVKEEYEIESIVAAQRIAEGAFDHILKVINYDMTEIEVAAELEYYMKKHGSEKPAFDTIAVSGKASSLPHGVPRAVKLERGFLTMDYGAMVNGYCSDMTRTIVIGKADENIKKVYNTVLKAQLDAEAAIKAGADCGEIDKVARDIIYGAGYEGKFGHGLGHGVGLLIHELPNQNMRSFGRKLVTGNIVTVEPGIYLEGLYGCRIEDMLAVTDDGAVNLTNCTKELIEI